MKAVIALFFYLALLLPGTSVAQDYPARPITLVVPFQAGGPVDIVPRIIGERLSPSLKVPVVVENKAGAGGNIGAAQVAKANPDGYVLLATAGGVLTANPWLFRDARFNPDTDFVPIVGLASTANVVVVSPKSGITTMKELIQRAKAPGQIHYSSPGVGTTPHLCMELLKQMSGAVALTHVPYKGGAEAVRDVMSGEVQASCTNLPNVVSLLKTGKLRALAVTSQTRDPLFPEVPTVEEAGLPGFESIGWFGLVAPAKTPPAIVDLLNKEVNRALQDPAVQRRLAEMGMTRMGGTQEDFKRYIDKESSKWRKLIELANITS